MTVQTNDPRFHAAPGGIRMVDNLCGAMTLRDWFAGMALGGFMSNDNGIKNLSEFCKENSKEWERELSRYLYAIADAMLEERGK